MYSKRRRRREKENDKEDNEKDNDYIKVHKELKYLLNSIATSLLLINAEASLLTVNDLFERL